MYMFFFSNLLFLSELIQFFDSNERLSQGKTSVIQYETAF